MHNFNIADFEPAEKKSRMLIGHYMTRKTHLGETTNMNQSLIQFFTI